MTAPALLDPASADRLDASMCADIKDCLRQLLVLDAEIKTRVQVLDRYALHQIDDAEVLRLFIFLDGSLAEEESSPPSEYQHDQGVNRDDGWSWGAIWRERRMQASGTSPEWESAMAEAEMRGRLAEIEELIARSKRERAA